MFNLNSHDITSSDCGYYYKGFYVYTSLADVVQVYDSFNEGSGDPDGSVLIETADADAAKVWIDEFVDLHS